MVFYHIINYLIHSTYYKTTVQIGQLVKQWLYLTDLRILPDKSIGIVNLPQKRFFNTWSKLFMKIGYNNTQLLFANGNQITFIRLLQVRFLRHVQTPPQVRETYLHYLDPTLRQNLFWIAQP